MPAMTKVKVTNIPLKILLIKYENLKGYNFCVITMIWKVLDNWLDQKTYPNPNQKSKTSGCFHSESQIQLYERYQHFYSSCFSIKHMLWELWLSNWFISKNTKTYAFMEKKKNHRPFLFVCKKVSLCLFVWFDALCPSQQLRSCQDSQFT